MRRGWFVAVLIAATAVVLASCMRPPALPTPDGVRVTPLRSISAVEGRVLVRLAGLKDLPVAYAVDCYRMEYPVVRANGEADTQSGLLALPRGVAPRRLISFQHGTSTTRTAVPSRPDGTGLAAAVLFAGAGYALVAPDYPGLGRSRGRHPYYVADEIGPSVVGMIEAAQRLDSRLRAPVFLSGFSEGGWASLAALRLLEADGRRVLGSAQVAGAYDLRRISLPAALRGGAPSHSLYLAYAAWGQAARYGRPLDSVLTSEHAALVARLFAGAKPKEIVDALPPDPRRMFSPGFLQAFDHDEPHWFLESFAANSLIGVTPRAPVRLYYGSQDRDVVPEEALAASRAMRGRGADVVAVDVGPVGHDASMLAAAPRIRAWLGELEASEPSRAEGANARTIGGKRP